MRVAIIGGTGHIGSYPTPRLFEAGHAVFCISRGLKTPDREHAAWRAIESVALDRAAEEAAAPLASVLPHSSGSGHRSHLLPARERAATRRGVARHVSAISSLRHNLGPRTERRCPHHGSCTAHGLLASMEFAKRPSRPGFSARKRSTPGDHPAPRTSRRTGLGAVNPVGNFNPDVFSRLSAGKTVQLPNIGMETLHHVHADDVAQCFRAGDRAPKRCAGRKLSRRVARTHHLARIRRARQCAGLDIRPSWNFYPGRNGGRERRERDAAVTWDHIAHSPNCSIAKARTLLGYEPRLQFARSVARVARLADRATNRRKEAEVVREPNGASFQWTIGSPGAGARK